MSQKPEVNVELAHSHGLTDDEYSHICESLGRTPTYEELGVVSVMWSEHCSYKSSRLHLKKLPTEAEWVLQGPGENAGVIDVGDGMAVCFKMESHNHPSFIEPYQGAATGVGGIMRDVFTMGARPVANLNSLRFGNPSNPRMRFLVEGVVAGIGGYGNCMGVPTVGGEIAFDDSYNGNILVNAFTLGVLKADRIFRSAAAGIGNDVVYVGSKTGRDGIHGATMASEEFGEDSEAKRPRVQVGAPFTEKKLLEACLELMKEDVIVAIQDMGAAGLTSSSCEMAGKGGLGIEIDIEKVPRRETGMTPYEVLLSESQERMLMVVKEGGAEVVERIFKKWKLDACVIGRITDTGNVVVKEHGEVVADLPAKLVSDEAPIYDRPSAPPNDLNERWTTPELPQRSIQDRLLELLEQPTIASKRWAYEQYDSSVRCGTVRGPGQADAAVIRMPNDETSPSSSNTKGIAMSVDMNGRLCQLDPHRGAAHGVLESARNLACVGAKAMATTDCLNFGSPERSEVMWSFKEALAGMGQACIEMACPIISGNVSFYNETEGTAILPTPTVGLVGVVADVTKVPGQGFTQDEDVIIALGKLDVATLGGSELVLLETGKILGRPNEPDFEEARAVNGSCIKAVEEGLLNSAHDVSEGGLMTAIAESCISGGKGAQLDTSQISNTTESLFGETSNVIIVSASSSNIDRVLEIAKENQCQATRIGRVTGDELKYGDVKISVDELRTRWDQGMVRKLGIV